MLHPDSPDTRISMFHFAYSILPSPLILLSVSDRPEGGVVDARTL